MAKKYKAHVVSHTHWDREWYQPFQHYRMRLVELTDALLDLLEKDPDFKVFHFDGQCIVLEDYLEIRPENEARLRKLIADGRILIGPWYNLPDEFLVSGESLVRNFIFGKRVCESFGDWQRAGYINDQFGHISQFPQILQGFGIPNAILFRGITTDQVKSEFLWQSPDGSEVLAIKMPDENAYSNYFYRLQEVLRYPEKPLDEKEVTDCVRELTNDCINEKPTTNALLFMDGCDHVFPQFKTPEIIRIANKNLDNVELVHSTFDELTADILSQKPALETVVGEMRWSNRKWKLQGILANVMSSRIHLKQMSFECERLLEKYVEPICAWAWLLGEEYPTTYINLAWKHLLMNSPHDSICGCSVDQVHKDMVYRYDQVKLIGERLLYKKLPKITAQIGSKAENPEKSVLLSVFNTLAFDRTDVAEAEVDLPGEWHVPALKVTDPEGNDAPVAIVGVKHYHLMEPEPYDIPLGQRRQKVKIAFLAEKVPAMGYKSYVVEVLGRPNRIPGSLLLGPDTAENEFLSLTVSSDGTVFVYDKETNTAYDRFLIYEDGGDLGDGYNYVKPAQDKIVTSLGADCVVSVVEDNPVRCVFEIVSDIMLPREINADRRTRSSENVLCRTKTYVTLMRGVKRIDVKTVFDNQAKDHRFRVLFPTGLAASVSCAESAYDVVERPIAKMECVDWHEPMPTTHPQKAFVSVNDEESGLTFANRGIPEYEVKDDEARTASITLLRATGNGVCGPEFQVEGQMIGAYTFDYSIIPHGGTWAESKSYRDAHSFAYPFIFGQTGIHEGKLPLEMSLVGIDAEDFVLSAVKKAENGDALIVRGYNTVAGDEKAALSVDGAQIVAADLAEDALDGAKAASGSISLDLKSRQIVTLRAEIK